MSTFNILTLDSADGFFGNSRTLRRLLPCLAQLALMSVVNHNFDILPDTIVNGSFAIP